MSSQLTSFLLNPATSRELALLAGHRGWVETLVLIRVLHFWQRYCAWYTTFTLWEFEDKIFKYPLLRILSIHHCINIKIEEPYPWSVAAAAPGLQQLGVGDQVQAQVQVQVVSLGLGSGHLRALANQISVLWWWGPITAQYYLVQVQVVSPSLGSGQLRALAPGTGQARQHHGWNEDEE